MSQDSTLLPNEVPSLTGLEGSTTLTFLTRGADAAWGGALVAETHLSTQSAPPSQDPRVPRAHEEQGRTQSAGGAPQEGTSSPHANLVPRGSRPGAREPRIAFLARCGCYGARSSKRYIAAGGRAPARQFGASRGAKRPGRTALGTARKKPWAAR